MLLFNFFINNPDIHYYIKSTIFKNYIDWEYQIQNNILYLDIWDLHTSSEQEQLINEINNLLRFNMIKHINIESNTKHVDYIYDILNYFPLNKILLEYK
jgi:hypothetical protein